ncbi:MAG: hypothetical protein A3E80_05395 [Chlamydiae bacterium RIFCSPHIGHO2_12_FULL_49_9]|nr:MAG: hypothetical protein A3E80_05395 [Chlamydiae bacterium RIFCSPHIGHO2_12_FULL_49_9]
MTVCVIPARFNSARFPGKLLAKAQGKTILQRTFERASLCTDLDALFVATDDEKIATHIESLGGQILWTSPDCQNGTERILEALKNTKALQDSSIILNVQGDHPCTEPKTMSQIIEQLKNDPAAPVATAVFPLKDLSDFLSPHIVKCVFDERQNALYFSRSPIPYHREKDPLKAFGHLGIYGYRTDFLLKSLSQTNTPLQLQEDLEQLKVLEKGYKVKIGIVDEIPRSVDTPEDLVKLERYLCP